MLCCVRSPVKYPGTTEIFIYLVTERLLCDMVSTNTSTTQSLRHTCTADMTWLSHVNIVCVTNTTHPHSVHFPMALLSPESEPSTLVDKLSIERKETIAENCPSISPAPHLQENQDFVIRSTFLLASRVCGSKADLKMFSTW